jgi:hypothetical protein
MALRHLTLYIQYSKQRVWLLAVGCYYTLYNVQRGPDLWRRCMHCNVNSLKDKVWAIALISLTLYTSKMRALLLAHMHALYCK